MDALVYFEQIVKPDYEDAKNDPNDLRRLWHAIVSVNTVADAVALERLHYSDVGRRTHDKRSAEVRDTHQSLIDLQHCADALKHVRKQTHDVTATSTNILPSDPSTWQIDINGKQQNLLTLLDQAYETITKFPELTQRSSC
jgi:hypothetical protein